jgi:hypothetical protein
MLPPGRTLLPEPDTGAPLDEDPLTSPRYAWDGRAERALRPGGYRSDWLSSRQDVTRPMSSPPRLSAQRPPAAADPAAPGEAPQPASPVPGALPKRARQPAQAAEPGQPERANGVRAAPDSQAAPSATPAADALEAAAPQAEAGRADIVQPDSGPLPPVPAQAGPPDAGPAGAAATSAIRRPLLPTRTPARPPAPSRSGETTEGTRSVWEPLAKNRSTPAAAETGSHAQPSVQAGPSAWESRLSRQSQETGGDAGPSAAAAQVTPASPPPQDARPPGPRSGALPRREPPAAGDQQARPGQLPRRQPMTHLAAPLRRDWQSAGRDQQAGDGRPLPSVWDTWRPAASVQRPAQQDAADSGDDQG